MECNAQKRDRTAEQYLLWLFRERRLGADELRGRFEALEMLAAGKLRPVVAVTKEGRRPKLRLYKEIITTDTSGA